MKNLLNTELTAHEAMLGFEKIWIENEHNRFGQERLSGEPMIVEAVVFKVTDSVWIFKMGKPDVLGGGIFYNEMQYGLLGEESKAYPNWENVRASNWPDPQRAIDAATNLHRDRRRFAISPPEVSGALGNRTIRYPSQYFENSNGRPVTVGGTQFIEFDVGDKE
jgi:hypothetical protein